MEPTLIQACFTLVGPQDALISPQYASPPSNFGSQELSLNKPQ